MNHLVITGGGGGLARAAAEMFPSPLWATTAPAKAELDVSDAVAIRGYFHGRTVDLLVCAAGITRDAPLTRLEEKDWDEVLSVNYRGAADCAAAVLPGMIRRGSGHVIFISSYSAFHPPPWQAAYATAKAALLGLTRSLAAKWGDRGIRVNAILPGFLETRMTENLSEKRKAGFRSQHVLGRFNTPHTVARFIRHLHEDLPHTSGQTFQLDSRIS